MWTDDRHPDDAPRWRDLLRRKQPELAPRRAPEPPAVTLRLAKEEDEAALARLAQLDSSRPPRGVVLLAEIDGVLLAAASLDDAHAVADPLRPTAELVWLLLERRRQLRRAWRGPQEHLPRVWPRALDARGGGMAR